MNTYYAADYPRLRQSRNCDLCGGLMPKGEHHTTWVAFSDGAHRAHAHMLCAITVVPDGPLGLYRNSNGDFEWSDKLLYRDLGINDDGYCCPDGGREDWCTLIEAHAPAAWIEAWADGAFHPAALHAWLHGLEIPT